MSNKVFVKAFVEIPEEVNWIACDENGETWGYEVEPEKNNENFSWLSSGQAWLLYTTRPPKDWKKEIYTWS